MERTSRNWRTSRVVLVAAVAATAGGAWRIIERHATATRNSAAVAAAAAAAAAESEVRVKDIAFYEARAATDRESAWDRARVAALYLQRAREANDFQYYVRAEESARAALALRTQHNAEAFAVLTSTLLAQHRFVEAREVARQLVASDPQASAYRAMLGETCLEVGDYAGARAAFESIGRGPRATLAVAPRLARWAEIRGDTAQARKILRRARTLADSESELPREQRAWFHLRMGELDLRQGRLDYAEHEFRAGLAALPGDHRLLGAMARLAAVRHEWRDAVLYGDSSIAIALDPTVLGVVADAYTALGDTAKAGEYIRTMEIAVGQQPSAYHRAWSLFLLDHGRQMAQVLATAETELVTRRDIYGYDLLAWALYKQGRPLEARRAMANALAQGTQDALLFYHAGMIERAAGNPAAARDYLRRALDVAPAFDATAPAIARAVIDTLDQAAKHFAVGAR